MAEIYKIGEVAKLCDISVKTLRYYEELGLISPVKVDIYTGYRYYNAKNIETVYKIQLLKELGFSLQEIKDFDSSSLANKFNEIKQQISKLSKNLQLISSLNKQKGELIMKPFINDQQVIGKWGYVATAESKEHYLKGDFYKEKENLLFKNLYFLPQGQGYWVFERWTKGIIYHCSGINYLYSIENNMLFLEIYNQNNEYETTLVYEKLSSQELTIDDIVIKENINLEFENDNDLIGFWEVIDFIPVEDKENYVPKKSQKQYYVKSAIIKPSGEVIMEDKENRKFDRKWTKGYIINKHDQTAAEYCMKKFDNETYLFMDWKSGDYIFGGYVFGCYVFKKVA